jgi:hypothetical protein
VLIVAAGPVTVNQSVPMPFCALVDDGVRLDRGTATCVTKARPVPAGSISAPTEHDDVIRFARW